MSARFIRGVLAFFAVGAAMGAALVLVAPVPFVRGLGAFTLGVAVVGILVQLYALHEFAPEGYADLRSRVMSLMQPAQSGISPIPVRTA